MVKRNMPSMFNSLSTSVIFASETLERFGMVMLGVMDKQNEIMRQNRRFWKYHKGRGK